MQAQGSESSGAPPPSGIGLKIIYPRRSICTTIRELGPKMPYYRRNYGSQFPNGCTYELQSKLLKGGLYRG